MSWSDLTEWWLSEVESDPSYREVVTPLLLEVLDVEPGRLYLDVGCGDGRVMKEVVSLGASVHGLDINPDLAALAGTAAVANMVAIPFRGDCFDGVYSVLALEHVVDHEAFFEETARVTKPDGVLAVVVNHPTWTAPEATPISDMDGEVLWRPGEYFSSGSTEMPAGEGSVTFHHRSMADLLNAAADAGWDLEQMIELPHHEFDDQSGIPRLLACRWRLSSPAGG